MSASTPAFDVAVVGGGIVGMATARELLLRRPRRLVVLEAETTLAAHQTGRNSGVIHSGLYYKPGSLKATLCVTGREAMYRFCDEHEILSERCGKVVVATRAEELPALAELERRGAANGITLVRCGPEQLREHEPHVRGIAGLFVADTGIVRYARVVEAMAADVARVDGCEVRRGARVERVDVRADELVVTTATGELRARNLVNCAGLQSDRVARMCGVEPGVQIIPFRGDYYDLVEARRGLCRNLIYPVPDPRFPFLGVHYTRSTDGSVECGPNAVLSLEREGYARTSFKGDDVADMVTYLGFWNMAATHWRMGMFEMHRAFSKAAFVRALGALVPEIAEADVVPARAGVRAQAVLPDGKLVDDFEIRRAPGMLHVLNAPSPAATASLAIAEHIARAAEEVFR